MRIVRWVTAVFLLALVTFVLLPGILYPRKISGNIRHNQWWWGRVHMIGDVVITPGAHVRIIPGTQVEVFPPAAGSMELGIDPQLSELIVQGELIADGSQSYPIVFKPHSVDEKKRHSYGWYGLVFEAPSASTSSINYVRFEHGKYGVYCSNSSPKIHHCLIKSCSVGVYVTGWDAARNIRDKSDLATTTWIEGNTFIQNEAAVMSVNHADPLVINTFMLYNNEGFECLHTTEPPLVMNNTFVRNGTALTIRCDPLNVVSNILSDNSRGIEFWLERKPRVLSHVYIAHNDLWQNQGGNLIRNGSSWHGRDSFALDGAENLNVDPQFRHPRFDQPEQGDWALAPSSPLRRTRKGNVDIGAGVDLDESAVQNAKITMHEVPVRLLDVQEAASRVLDLTVISVEVPKSVKVDEPIRWKGTMRNEGPDSLDYTETDLQGWISLDGVNRWKAAGGALVNIESFGQLVIRPGETRSIGGSAKVEKPGTYYVIVDVDQWNKVQESDETNNSRVSEPITVTP